ncbi:MAG: response regulator transcription factor [Betaproteobacteria bacterium]|nr:response regulator transcription factor [Betaproteobacteria bacterium]
MTTRPIRVVLVDDSKVFLDAIHSCLAEWVGMEIAACAASGAEGLSVIRRNRPDLVLMDVFMSNMNGLEASKRIERSNGLPKVMLMTGADIPGLHEAALEAGADAFVLKQHLYPELARRVEQWFPPTLPR